MRFPSKQPWLVWLLIFAQMTLGTLGYGRVILCNDQSGRSHIQIVRSSSHASHTAQPDHFTSRCQQPAHQASNASARHCTNSRCVDEALSFPCAINPHRTTGCKGLASIVPTEVPAIPVSSHPDLMPTARLSRCASDEKAVLHELHCAVRSTVLNL